MKLENIFVYAKTKVLFKFGSLEIVCVEIEIVCGMRPKKSLTDTCEVTVQHHCKVC